jgi:hypothetical protein
MRVFWRMAHKQYMSLLSHLPIIINSFVAFFYSCSPSSFTTLIHFLFLLPSFHFSCLLFVLSLLLLLLLLSLKYLTFPSNYNSIISGWFFCFTNILNSPTFNKICCSHLLTLVPRSLIFPTLKMETIHSSETSVHTRSRRRHIPEADIL